MAGRLEETLKSINSQYGTNLSSDSVKSSQAAKALKAVGAEPTGGTDGTTGQYVLPKRISDLKDNDYVSQFFSEYNSFLEDLDTRIRDVSYDAQKEIYTSNLSSIKDLLEKSDAISYIFSGMEDVPDELRNEVTKVSESLKQISKELQNTQNTVSKYDSEEAYNTAKQENAWLDKYSGKDSRELESLLSGVSDEKEKSWLGQYQKYVDYEEKSKLDTDDYAEAIRMLEEKYNTYKTAKQGDITAEEGKTEMETLMDLLDETGAEIDKRKAYLQAAKLIQEKEAGKETYDAIRNNADFEQFSRYDPAKQEIGYQYINADANGRENLKQKYGQYAENFEENAYDSMSDKEKETYNYLMNIGNRQGAADYLKYLQEDLGYRKAQELFEGYEDHKGLEYVFGLEAGLDQARAGMQGFGNLIAGREEYVPASYKQQLSGMIREDLGDGKVNLPGIMGGGTLGQAVYDTVTTSANMAPSIVASTAIGILNPAAGAAVGNALMGATAAGNAYTEAINAGFSKEDARGYGLLVGASEMVMEKVLGGITGLGGNAVSKNLVSNLNAADTAFKMVIKRIGGGMLSEFGEEYLQEVLTPVIKNLTLGTHEDVQVFSAEALYSGILGALTAFVMEGPSGVMEASGIKNTGKAVQEADAAERLAELGRTFSADTVAYQLAGKVDANTDAFTLGRLFNEIGASMSEQNKTDITNALIAQNRDPAIARKNAETLSDLMEGKKVSKRQQAMIEKDDILSKVAVEVLVNENSTVNQRMKGYSEVGQAMVSGNKMSAEKAHSPAAPATKQETVEKKQYDLGGTGKTTYIPDGKEVRIKEIASIKDGKMQMKLEDGRTVDSKDVGYANESEALVYESIAKMDVNAAVANALVNAYNLDSSVGAEVYVKGVQEAYRYGQYGYPNTQGPFSSMLTEQQRNTAYKLGKMFSGQQVAKEQAVAGASAKVANRIESGKKTSKGGVFFEGSDNSVTDWDSYANKPELKPTQEVAIQTMKVLSQTLGIKFYVGYDMKTKDGRPINGSYNPADGSIHIDLNAGMDSQKTMLFTLSHEMTHFIRQWSPAKFKVLANFLMKEFVNSGDQRFKNMDAWVHAKMKETGLKYADAYEEVVADAMEGMLADGKVMEKLVKLKQQDKTLWQKIKDFIDNWAAKLKEAYEGLKPDSAEGKAVLEMTDKLEEIQQLFAEGLVEASENYQASQKTEAKETEPAAMAASVKKTAVQDDVNKYSAKTATETDSKKHPYSYETLISKPDMKVTLVGGNIPKNRADVVAQAKKNAAEVGKFNPKDSSVSVHVNDIGRDVILGTAGLKHSLDRRMDVNASITLMAGKILQNSIKINELTPQKAEADESYVLIGAAKNSDGELFVVRSVVNRFSNELASMDVLYAINAKKENRLRSMRPGFQGPVTDSTISIADLLEHVNQYFPEVLPEDVLKHFGHDARPDGKLGDSALYSVRNTESVSNRSLLIRVDESSMEHPTEAKRLREYKETVAKAEAEEQVLRELNEKIRTELDQKKVKSLRFEANKSINRLAILDKQILRKEAELKTVLEREQKMAYLQGEQKRADAYEKYRIETEVEHLKTMREYRATRAELHDLKDDTKVMEKEFVRVVKEYERQAEASKKQTGKDAETITKLRQMLDAEAQKHKEESAVWQKEFSRLLKEYDAAGRKIDRLETEINQKRKYIENNVEGRKRTVLRTKIKKDIHELEKILNRGTKKRNVKQGMQDMVTQALRTGAALFADLASDVELIANGIQTDMTVEERRLLTDVKEYLRAAPYFESAPNKSTVLEETKKWYKEAMVQLKPVFDRERARINSTDVKPAFNALSVAYKSLKDSEDQYIKMAYSENVQEYLDNLQEKFAGTLIKDMNTEQLQALHDGYKMIMKTIRDANKAFVDGRSIQADAEQTVRELQSIKKPKGKAAVVAKNVFNAVGWNYEKFYYALERVNSPTMKRLFGNLAESENITMRDVQEAKAFQQKTVEKYRYNDWDIDKKIKHTFVDNNGKEFHLTLGEMMALYAYSRRAGADKHIEVGGFSFGKTALTDANPATTYKLTAAQVEKITSMLTDQQKSFAREMQKFITEVMGEKGNEVTMKLYGIKLYTEENYFPLHIAGDFKAVAQESQAQAAEGFKTMANAGFTHARNMNSTAPIVLEDFMTVWADHVNEMARYHGAVPALEDIRRVMNYSVYSDASKDSVSVKAALKNAYGEQAVNYFDRIYREANSGAVRDAMVTLPAKALSLFRKGSVAYSLSVVIQQPASIYRAKMLVDGKYFGKHGLFTLTNGTLRIFNKKKWDASYEEMMKYAPGVTMAKEIGGFDTSSGSSIRSYLLDTEKTRKQEWKHGTATQKAGVLMGFVDDNVIANMPNVADKIAWIEMWEACKRETIAKNHDLSPNSDAFLQKVGERFTEVIRATQVYDSMFAKSPMLNSKNTAVQSLVSFMNEPNTVANMAEDAIRKFVDGDRKYAVRTASALLSSIIATNALKSIIYAMRDDDEDETFWEKYVSAFAGNLINDFNPANYIPVARDIVSVAQGYDVERTDMTIIADVFKAVQKLKDLSGKDTSDMSEKQYEKWEKECTEAEWRVAETLAQAIGIPLKNIRRDVKAIANTVKIANMDKGRESTATSIRLAIEEGIKGSDFQKNRLYEAIVSGDEELVKRIRSEYDKDSEYNSAVRSALKDNDARIKEAAKAWNSNDLDEYNRIVNEIIAENKFTKDDVVSAIRSKAESLDHTEPESQKEKSKSLFNAEKFAVAISQGDTDMAKTIQDDLVKTAMDNGDDADEAKKSFNSSAKSALKELYKKDDISEDQAIAALKGYCDMSRSDAEQLIREWDFEVKHDMSYSEMFTEYKKGNVTEKDMRAAMKEVGLKEYEIAEKLRSVKEDREFFNKFKMTYSEAQDAYMEGQISKSKMREMLIYNGKSAMQADDTLLEWDVAKRFGIPYDKLDDAYKYGDITRQQLYSAMIAVGESPKKAEEALACYDWLKARVKEHPDLQISDARKFVTSISDTCDEAEEYTLTDYGISVNTYEDYKLRIADAKGVDADNDGETDSGSLRTAKFAIIDKMNISKSQKDALAMISYSMKSIRRNAPWH